MATFATFASAAARGLGLRAQVTPASLRTAATTTRSYASSGESSLQTPPNHHTHFRRSKAEASSKRVLRADFKPATPPSPLSLCLSLVVFGKPDSISLFLFSILTNFTTVGADASTLQAERVKPSRASRSTTPPRGTRLSPTASAGSCGKHIAAEDSPAAVLAHTPACFWSFSGTLDLTASSRFALGASSTPNPARFWIFYRLRNDFDTFIVSSLRHPWGARVAIPTAVIAHLSLTPLSSSIFFPPSVWARPAL